MPTTKIISTTAPEPQEIDWNKPQFLKSHATGAIVYSTGNHSPESFNGWCYTGEAARTFSDQWKKVLFAPMQGKVLLEISNEED